MIDKSRFTIVSMDEIKEQRRQRRIKELHSTNLSASLSIPSVINSYSIGVGIIKKWYFERIEESFYKYKTVDESNYNKAFDKAQSLKNLKIQRPSLMIIPRLETEFNREGLDHNLFGANIFLRTKGRDRAFLKDPNKNINLAIELDMIKMNFTFRTRLNTKAQQLDLMRQINFKCRIGGTHTEYIDMDFHIPYDLMCQLAKDAGFRVVNEDNKKYIANTLEFVKYLNSKSQIPVLYKYRAINGRFEFFLRMEGLPVHIDTRDQLSIDEGEMIEQLKTNYNIEMTVNLSLPVPKFYAYYSENQHEINSNSVYKYTIPIDSVILPNIPKVNDKEWNRYYETDIMEEDLSKPLEFDFEELFNEEDSKGISLIRKIIDHNNENYISSSVFMEIKLFNGGEELDYTIDWNKFHIKANNCQISHMTHMAIYVDMLYVNQFKINMNKLSDDRFRSSENQK